MNPTNGHKSDRMWCAVDGLFLLLLCLGGLGNGRGFRAQAVPGDAVEHLRQVLQGMTDDASVREQKLRECIETLRGVGDLRRAFLLAEWRDRAPDSSLAAVDRS